jgi:hypothetical protein
MYCDKCGQEVKPGQRFCDSCGKAVSPIGIATPASRLAKHLHILGILWLVYAALALLGAVVTGILSITLFAVGRLHDLNSPNFNGAPLFLHALFILISGFLFIKSMAAVFTGFGLMNRQSWARSLAIVLAFLAMLSIPFGLALGIYTLWVLMSPTAEEEYRSISTSS